MPISRTLMLPDARATRSVSPSVHDTTRPFAGADHACGIANVTIAATNITNLIARPTHSTPVAHQPSIRRSVLTRCLLRGISFFECSTKVYAFRDHTTML